jgi:prolyl-tRNA synthetase
MRWSQGLIPTFKEDPADAETPSHRLMIRAGLMSKVAAGVYSLLPLGLRAVQKVEAIVRQEMNRAGAQEILMPVLSPRELWEESGRWKVYGDELMRITDRHDRQFALGPTHEEVVTDIVRRYVKSYRQLPITLYQIQTKFRDEIRPRFGVMRAREFMMKDAYSFHADEASLHESYRAMHLAYRRIFWRCGLRFGAVEAATGAIGGDTSHEFMVFAGTGESEVLHCECGYAATTEQAQTTLAAPAGGDEAERPLEKVSTPGKTSVEEVAAYLKVEPARLIKTLIYRTGDGEFVAALVRGDREVAEEKMMRALGGVGALATPAEIEKATGGPLGYSGPVGLGGLTVLADHSVAPLRNAVTGANEADAHYVNVNAPRDYRATREVDILLAREGDPCPRCGKAMGAYRGIEVGQIFQLGEKYSESMQAGYLDETGSTRRFIMGCYGIGVTRTVAAAIEQHHDEHGVAWPASIAPYDVEVLPVNVSHDESVATATRLYRELGAAGISVLLDDRDERAGNKFKDADLVGMPLRVTVGERGLVDGVVELRVRKTGVTMKIPVDDAAARVREAVAAQIRELEEAAPLE